MMRSGKTSFRYAIGAGATVLSLSLAGMAHAEGRYSAIVMDARSGEVLQQESADEERYPASLTKMMTLYMLFEALDRGEISMSTRLAASRHATHMAPSRLGIRRGDTLSVEQAIRAIVVQSANDVAVMVAEKLGGSEPRFASMMTARARALGMQDTHFVNASGLPDPRQHTTARDMALLGQHLWRDFPQRYAYFQTTDFSWRNRYIRGHNHLLGRVDGVDGIKTGYTRASGYNLVSSAERNGRRVIVVVMGGESASARDSQVAYLIDGAFEEWARRDVPGVTYASAPTHRLDVTLTPSQAGGVTATAQASTTFAPGAAPQGVVVQTLSTSNRGVLAPATQAEDSTDEGEEGDSSAAQQSVPRSH